MALKSSSFLVLALALLALGLRIGVALELGGDLRVTDPIIDGKLYLEQATAWAEGERLDEPYFAAPLYPAFLWALVELGTADVGTIRGLQAVLGWLGTLLLALAVRRDFGASAAALTALLAALYGPLLAIETQVLGAPLLFFLVALALWLWPGAENSRVRWTAFGWVLGLLVAGRGTFALLLVGFTLATLGRIWKETRRSGTRGVGVRGVDTRGADTRGVSTRGIGVALRPILGRGLFLGVGFLIVVLPISVHQTRTTGSLEWTTLNGGLNLYLGNNPWARGIYSTPPDLDIQGDFTGRVSASKHLGRPLSLPEADDFWRDRAGTFFREHPGRAAWLWGRKALLYLSPREIPQIENFRLLARDTLSLHLAAVRFSWILPLACLGLGVSLWSDRRSETRRPLQSRGLAPYAVVLVVGLVSTLLFFATARYRIPFLPGFLALAGIGLASIWSRVRERRLSPGLLWGFALVLAVAALQWTFPTYPEDKANGFAFHQLGLRYQQKGEHASAVREFDRALASYPALGEAWRGAAASRVQLGDLSGAVESYQRSIELLADPTWALYSLGITYGQSGNDAAAAEALTRARTLQPQDPRIRASLAIALGRLGQLDAARVEIEEALRIDPAHEPSLRTRQLLEQMAR